VAIGGLASACLVWEIWWWFVYRKQNQDDLRQQGDEVLQMADDWVENEEKKFESALDAANAASNLVDTKASETSKQAFYQLRKGLNWFKGARQFTKKKLREGLDFLASEADENPPVTATVRLVWLNVLAFFVVNRLPGAVGALQFNPPDTLLQVSATGNVGQLLISLPWLQMAATSGLLHPSTLSVSGTVFFLVAFGRVTELNAGQAELVTAYIICTLCTNAVCVALQLPPLPGLAAAGACAGLMLLAFSWTLLPALCPKHPVRNLLPWRLCGSLLRVEWRRLAEAGLLILLFVAWLDVTPPTSLISQASRGWWFGSPPPTPWIQTPEGVVLAGGLCGAAVCRLLLFPIISCCSGFCKTFADQFGSN